MSTLAQRPGNCKEAGPVPSRRNWWTATKRAVSAAKMSGGAIAVFDQAVVSGTNFATIVMVERLGSQESLGVYYLAFTIVVLARGVQGQLVSAPYGVLVHRRSRQDDLAEYAGSLLVHHLLLAATCVVGLLLLLGVLSVVGGPAGLTSVVWILLVATPLILLRDFVRGFCFAHLNPAGTLVVDVIVAAIQLGGLALLGAIGGVTAGAAYAITGGACAVASIAWFLSRNRHEFRWRVESIRRDWLSNWRFGRWALASYLVGSTSLQVLPWIIAFTHGAAATGVWAACMSLVGLANVFVQGMLNWLSPRAAHTYAKGGMVELRRILWIAAGTMIAALGAFLIVVGLSGDYLIVLVYGSLYAGTGMAFLLLTTSVLLMSVGAVAGNGLWAIGRPADNFAGDVSAILATLLAACVLIAPFGVLGAAIAASLGYAFGVTVRIYALRRAMRQVAAKEGER